MNNDKIMTLGINQARKTMNDNKGGPFGAVITDKKGNIISISSNLVLETYDPTAHAEINVIREASKKLKTHEYAIRYQSPCRQHKADASTLCLYPSVQTRDNNRRNPFSSFCHHKNCRSFCSPLPAWTDHSSCCTDF